MNQPVQSSRGFRGHTGSHQGPWRRRSPVRDLGGRRVIEIAREMNVQLHQTDNAWRPVCKDRKDLGAEEDKSQALYKTVVGILNKLTPQKFEALTQQVMDLQIDTEERLKGVVRRIYEKAVDEANFSTTYANLCKRMAEVSFFPFLFSFFHSY